MLGSFGFDGVKGVGPCKKKQESNDLAVGEKTGNAILPPMKKLIAQFMKFGVVGAIAFVIDYGLLALLTEVFGVNYLVSATISFTASVVFNYVASMRYVFTHKENMSRRREFIIFVVLSVIGLLINNGLMWAGVELLHVHYLIVKIFATAVVMVWNFVTRKIFLDAGDADAETGHGAA